MLYAIRPNQHHPVGPQTYKVQHDVVTQAAQHLPVHLKIYVIQFLDGMKKSYESRIPATSRTPTMQLLAFLNTAFWQLFESHFGSKL